MKKRYQEPIAALIISTASDILTTSDIGEITKIGSAGEYLINGRDL